MGAKQGIIQEPIVSKLNYFENQRFKIKNNICQRPPPFCCCFNPQNKSIMTISKLDYQVNVNLGFITVTMYQTYENNLEQPTDLEYVFMTKNSSAFIKLEAEFGDKKLIGLIKGKQEASREYQEGIQKGKTMLYSYQDDGYPDIMRVKLGNIAPKSKIIVNYQYIQPLEVTVNEFWRIELEQVVHPSYLIEPQNIEAFKLLEQFIDFGSFKYDFLQDINITVNLPKPITFCQSPTHKILIKNKGQLNNDKDLIILDPDYQENFKPNNRFILLFSNKEVHQPIISLSYSDRDELKQEQFCANIAFIPKFNNLELDDAYQAYLNQNDLDTQEFSYSSKGEFIFLLDRSRSMSKKRFKKAKNAVELFIRSLPEDSYFNVISFGGKFEKLWQASQKYSQCSAQEAIDQIENMVADLKGTRLFQPLQYIYEQPRKDGYPLNIFILTDGKVRHDPVIDLVKNYSKPDIKVYCLFIGRDCSRCLVEYVALAGNGKFHCTYDNEDLNSKVIDLLQDSMSPQLENFELVHNLDNPYCIVPNPQSVKFVKKNSQFTIQILFPRQDKKQLNFVLSYFDPQLRQQCQFNINILQSAVTKSEQYHKLAAFKQIQIIEDAFQQREEYVENLLISRQELFIQDIISISLAHQIISRQTAFICEIAGPEQNLKEMLKQKVIEDEFSSNQFQLHESKKEKINWSDIDSHKYREKQLKQQLDQYINNEFNDETSPTKINVPVFIKKRSEQRYQQEQDYKTEQNQLMKQKELDKFFIENQKQLQISAINILKYAQIDGQFDPKILNLFQIQPLTIPEGLNGQQWINIFVINYLQMVCSKDKGVWQLIVKKTEENIKRKDIKQQAYREEIIEIIKKIR